MDEVSKRQVDLSNIEEKNIIALNSIGVIPSELKQVAEKLRLKENVKFSSVDEVVAYLKRRQNIFTHVLESFGRTKETNTPAIVEILNENMGWEKMKDGEVVGALRDDPEAMFTAKDLCTLASVSIISFLKDALKDQDDAEVHMLVVDAKKKTTQTGVGDSDTFRHNVVHIRIGDKEVIIDPTYRQVDSEHPDPFLFITDLTKLADIYVPDIDGNVAYYADNEIGNQKTISGITDEQEEYFQRILRTSD